MFRKLLQRRQERREIEAKLEALTDPTLIHRMYRTVQLERNIHLHNLSEGMRQAAAALAGVGMSVKQLNERLHKK